MRRLLITAALLPALATASTPSDSINDLFAGTCMKHFYSQDNLRKAMGDIGAPEAPPEKAEFFLDGNSGTAWFVVAPSTTYVVALRDDTVCAVFAQRADPNQVHAGFSALVGTAPEPLMAAAQEATGLGPNAPYTRTMAYTWSRSEDKDELLFVLTTSDSSDATAQAMVSMSLVGKANNSFKAMPLRGTP
ncbi:NMCC_0638 family (lipo)protein [Luteimonas terricola]|uniref:NMCC_0638 family (lipo)protein n=1 Tax=Luteimonas terricola TaxID=645597 RepID=UPI003CCCA3D8